MANKFYKTNSKSMLLLQIDTLLDDRTACSLSFGAGLVQDGLGLHCCACIEYQIYYSIVANFWWEKIGTSLPHLDMRAMMVDWLKFARWSVCIFLRIEKPRSESALEAGIDKSAIVSFTKEGNLHLPSRVSIFPTSHQYLPTQGL